MKTSKSTIDKKPYLSRTVSVSIGVNTKNRLDAYVNSQNPRPVMADVASLAIERYLDEQEAGE